MRGTMRGRGLSALALMLWAAACAERPEMTSIEKADAPLANAAGPAAAVQVVSGSGQIGLVGENLANPLVVRVVDAAGVPVAGKSVSWRVTAGSGSFSVPNGVVSNADGIVSANWKLGAAAGTQSIEAWFYVGATPVTAAFTATATDAGGIKWWTGAVSRDFLDQHNWTPEGVPTSRDTVRIDASANGPRLDGNGSIGRLEVASGATLEVNTGKLAVAGAVFANGAVTGTGTVWMTGGAHVRGHLPSLEIAKQPTKLVPVITALDSVWVNGDLTVNGTYDPSGQWTYVKGNLTTTTSEGRLRMLSGGTLVVDGNASFLANGTPRSLLAGELVLKGNLTVRGLYAFQGDTAFRTRLVGTTQQQVVDFTYGSMSVNRFGDFRLENPYGVKLVGNVAAQGEFEAFGGPVVGNDTLVVSEEFYNLHALTKLGGLQAGWYIAADANRYDVGTTTFAPTVQREWNWIEPLPYKYLVVKATSNAISVRFRGEQKIAGNLDIPFGILSTGEYTIVEGKLTVGNAGTLALGGVVEARAATAVSGSAAKLLLGGNTLKVWGDMNVASSRSLQMLNANDELRVDGNFTIQGDQRGAFKAGTLRLRRNFTATGTYGFVSDPGHKVIFDGNQEQLVSFSDTLGYSSFHKVTVDNQLGGVRFASPRVRIRNELTLLGKMTVSAGTTLDVLGYSERNSSGVVTWYPATFRWGVQNSATNNGAIRANGLESIDGMTPLRITGPMPVIVGCTGMCPL